VAFFTACNVSGNSVGSIDRLLGGVQIPPPEVYLLVFEVRASVVSKEVIISQFLVLFLCGFRVSVLSSRRWSAFLSPSSHSPFASWLTSSPSTSQYIYSHLTSIFVMVLPRFVAFRRVM